MAEPWLSIAIARWKRCYTHLEKMKGKLDEAVETLTATTEATEFKRQETRELEKQQVLLRKETDKMEQKQGLLRQETEKLEKAKALAERAEQKTRWI